MSSKTKTFSVSIDAELLEWVTARAFQEMRTRNNYINYIIKKEKERYEKNNNGN